MTDIRKYNIYEEGTVCFMHNDAESWRLTRITAVEGDVYTGVTCTEQGEDDEDAMVLKASGEKIAPLDEASMKPVRDLLEMNYLHDSILLHQIRRRYWDDIMYTNIGPIVLSLNPYNFHLPLYVDSNMPKYISERENALHGGTKQPTHAWSVAHDAYWSMRRYSRCQAILVSGESGAGKTEAAKIVTKYIANVSTFFAIEEEKVAARAITEKIEKASPILEAFGNAKTLRNDNSSRFGKFMKLQFNDKGYLHGCHTINYLLEKSRVVTHSKGERSYHTFYQLVAGASPEERARYRLDDPSRYAWLYSGIPQNERDAEIDAQDFSLVKESFQLVGFSDDEVDAMYRVVAGILHLQHMEVGGTKDKAELTPPNREIFDWVTGDLWQVDKEVLYKELTTSTTTLRGEKITKPLGLAQAIEVRDAMSKALYERAFSWIVGRLNDLLDKEADTPKDQWVGLLDIFGFENFDKNSFEQLCINYANEQLQNHYNTCVFARDIAEYEQEGINTASLDPPDNTTTLQLIAAQQGVFQLLNDQARAGTDQKFLESAYDRHHRHKAFKKPRVNNGTFAIEHYAGEVWYTAEGMREKNNDTLKDSIRLIMRCSENKTIRHLLEPPTDDNQKLSNTVSRFFHSSLQKLITMIDETNPHWIRCVKPHPAKKPRMFSGSGVMNQLRFAGVLETVRIRQTGYSMRIPHSEFWLRYRFLVSYDKEATRAENISSDDLTRILEAAGLDNVEAQIGVTKVFIKDAPYKRLEIKRNERLDHLAIAVQRFAYQRKAIAKAHAKRLLQLTYHIQSFARTKHSSYVFRRVELAWWKKRITTALLLQKTARAFIAARDVYKKKVLRDTKVIQMFVRAKPSEAKLRENEAALYSRKWLGAALIQRCCRAKASEMVYQSRGEDLVDYLTAELEVKKEIEEEKRRAEEARKQALRDKVRAAKGLAPMAAGGPTSASAAAQEEEDDDTVVVESEPQGGAASGGAVRTVAMSEEQMQRHLDSQREIKKLQKSLQRVQQQLDQSQRMYKARGKEIEETKQKNQMDALRVRQLEQQLAVERGERAQLQQQLIDSMRDRARAEEMQAQLRFESRDDPALMQQMADNMRSSIENTYSRLAKHESEVVRLKTSAILKFPYGKDLGTAVRQHLREIMTAQANVEEVAEPEEAEIFRVRDLVAMLNRVMRDVNPNHDMYHELEMFCQFAEDLEKSLVGTRTLTKEMVLQHIRKPLKLLMDLCKIDSQRQQEDREQVNLQGLEPGMTSILQLGSALERIKRHHEPVLKRLNERENSVQRKVDRMEHLQQEAQLVHTQLPELDGFMSKLVEGQQKCERMRDSTEEQDKHLKEAFQGWLQKQSAPLSAVEEKRNNKQLELEALRTQLTEKRKQMQEEFFTLVQVEEMVAYIVRDYEYLKQIQNKVEVKLAKRRERSQGRILGFEAGATLLSKEHKLVQDISGFLEVTTGTVRQRTQQSLGQAHELNYELLQRHFAQLEKYYSDIMQLLQQQRQELFQQEAKLHAKRSGEDKSLSIMDRFTSKEKQYEKQKLVVVKLKEQLRNTHETLMHIRQNFKELFLLSTKMNVAESLARYDRKRYGHLLSTSTIPDYNLIFTWPDIDEVFERPPEFAHLGNTTPRGPREPTDAAMTRVQPSSHPTPAPPPVESAPVGVERHAAASSAESTAAAESSEIAGDGQV